jgi:hypothetical protein
MKTDIVVGGSYCRMPRFLRDSAPTPSPEEVEGDPVRMRPKPGRFGPAVLAVVAIAIAALATTSSLRAGTTNIIASADAFVRGQGTYWGVDVNYGTWADFYFDQIDSTGEDIHCERAFVGFDISGLEGQVTNATLSVFAFDGLGKTFTAYRVTREDWTELGVTWINADKNSVPATAWNAPGGDYDATKSATQGPSGTGQGRKNLDVTEMLEDAIAAGHSFVGFMLVCPEGGARCHSREYAGYEPEKKRPLLIVHTTDAVAVDTTTMLMVR